MTLIEKAVEELAARAADSEESDDAMMLAQAALNLARAVNILSTMKRNEA